jgi:hypothetical protein
MRPGEPAAPASRTALSADQLALRMNGIREPRMRVAAVAEALAEGSPDDAAALLAGLLARAGDAVSGHRAALDAALLVLGDHSRLDYDRRAALYAAATEAGLPDVALLLFEVAPPVAGTDELLRKLDDERPLVPSGRPLTLGERKSLARGHRRDLLLHLLREPHPDVVAILLDNSHLTEGDVLKIATRRPALPATLTAVYQADRWRARAGVRRALVLNPYTPRPLAARLMTTMPDGELVEVSHDPGLPDALRQHAVALLGRRRTAGG